MKLLKAAFAAALLFCLAPANEARAQCSGQFAAGQFCGNGTGSTALPRATQLFNAANTWTQTQTITPPAATATQGFNIQQSGPTTGTTAGVTVQCQLGGQAYFAYNNICISSDAANVTGSPNPSTVGLAVGMVTGGANSDWNKAALDVSLNHTTASNAAHNRDNVAGGFGFSSLASEGGTDTGAGAKGTGFGSSSACILQAGALNYFGCVGSEFVAGIQATDGVRPDASSRLRWAVSLISNTDLQATDIDAALVIGGTSGGPGWLNGIIFENLNGGIPIATTGCIMCTDGSTNAVGKGIDFSPWTVTGNFITGPGSTFAVTGTGFATSIGLAVNDGTVNARFDPTTLFSAALEVGTVSNHNVVFVQNNTLAGYFDTSKKLNLGLATLSQGALIFHGLTSGTLELAVGATGGSNKITLPAGTTDFTVTGGASRVVQQLSAGAAFTVARLACADLSDAASGCSASAGSGTVTSIVTTTPISGGTITTTGTISCPTCVTGGPLTNNNIMVGAGLQAAVTITTGTGVLTALGVNIGSAGAFVAFNGALGTPSSGTVTNLTGTASININGTVGASSQTTGQFTSLAYSTTLTGTSTNASALAVGRQGTTTPAFSVDASTASQTGGLKVTGSALNGTVALAVTDTSGNTNLTINALGSGTIGIGSVSTGAVTITPALTLSAALTYGGVTLTNSVTGTGSMALSASPTFTGTLTNAGIATNGTTTITSASATALTVGRLGATTPALLVDASTATSITGVKIKSAATGGGVAISAVGETNVNTTIDAAGSGTLVLAGTSTGAITLTRATTISAALTYGGVTLSNAVTGTGNMALSASPTFTGTLTAATITPTTINAFTLAGTISGGGNQINNVIIGNSSPLAGSFTSLASTLSTISAAAGTVTALIIKGGGNAGTDAPALDFTSLAGTVVGRQFADAAGGATRIKAIGNLVFHAGDIGFTGTNPYLQINTAGGITMPSLPTSAGAGGLNVCIDTAGALYKKATCP